MPTGISEITETGIVAGLLRERRRQARAITAAQTPIWTYDTFTISGSGDTAHTLTYVPYGINVALLNGVGLVEGTDYTADYTTGIVTISATLTAGDVLHVRYVTTGDLIAASGHADSGIPPTFVNATTAATTASGGASSLAVASPTCVVGDLLLLAFQIDNFAGTNVPSSPPTGWSLVASASGGPTVGIGPVGYYVYTKTANATDAAGTTYTASIPGTTRLTLTCLSYGPGAVDASATNSTASGAARTTTWTSPTVTTTDARTIVAFYAIDSGSTGISFSGPGSPTTVRADAAGSTPPFQFIGQRVIDEPLAAAGPSTARTVTCTQTGVWAGITVALSS